MLRSNEEETEILLGNKQLLGVFFVIAILLGVAFTGGYMVGRRTPPKTTAAAAVSTGQDTASASPSGSAASSGETHSVAPDNTPTASDQAGPDTTSTQPPEAHEQPTHDSNAPLGSRSHKQPRDAETSSEPSFDVATQSPDSSFSPEAGQEFLQVAAVGRDEAEAVADVLHKKGFRAHAVPKPGNAKLYRVLIGPIRDPGDLSTTRDALRRTGFREVIVQKY